jgi:hypothetical protein
MEETQLRSQQPVPEQRTAFNQMEWYANKLYHAFVTAATQNKTAHLIDDHLVLHGEAGSFFMPRLKEIIEKNRITVYSEDRIQPGQAHHIYVSLLDENTTDHCFDARGKLVHGHSIVEVILQPVNGQIEVIVKARGHTEIYGVGDDAIKGCINFESEYVRKFYLIH